MGTWRDEVQLPSRLCFLIPFSRVPWLLQTFSLFFPSSCFAPSFFNERLLHSPCCRLQRRSERRIPFTLHHTLRSQRPLSSISLSPHFFRQFAEFRVCPICETTWSDVFPPFRQCSISSSLRRSRAPAFRHPLGRLSCLLSSPLFILIFYALLRLLASESSA